MKILKITIVIALLAGIAYAGYRWYQPEGKIKTDPGFYEIKGQIMQGFPEDFPVYPGAVLQGSATVNTSDVPAQGYRVKWTLDLGDSSVPEIMNWYERELPSAGWNYTPPDDPESVGEQVAVISKDDLVGYIAAEIEDNIIEIIVDLRVE